ncbi:protein FREE1 isoform X2 [Elaeis guineensis]|uniref:Protein FREE1 n=1 Tax=Elaeis guineensis var. tenera TaxID=51953 RepID=A0A6I9RZJ4_ELAGV|nr:protein FREE1 [Elaeis guineensis]
MQQGGDYGSAYYPHQYPPRSIPNPNPNAKPSEFPSSNPIQPSYASAPPYSHYSSAEFPAFSSSYHPYSENPDPVPNLPPSAPSYTQPPSQLPPQNSQLPPYQPYNPSPYPPEQPSSAPFPHLQQSPSVPYYPYDSHQPAGSYAPPKNPNPNPSPPTDKSLSFSAPFPPYDNPYESSAARFDHGGGYFSENSGRYGAGVTAGFGPSGSGFDHDFYERKPESGLRYDRGGPQDDLLGEGVYAYDGGRVEPYGSRGTAPTRSSTALFDDYGRSISFPSGGKDQGGSVGKIVRAVPKVDTQQDVKNGVQKFRVKLLAEGGGQSTLDVLCQIGLDGIRMLDPSSSRTLRIYPLETVTRWDVTDSSIFTFWSKSSVDIEPRRIRLQSNSYTTSTILDTVTAAAVQLKEMGGKDSLSRGKGTADGAKLSELPTEKKKGFADWLNLMKPGNEEKDHWVPDEAVNKCTSCGTDFGAFVRRHHCRNCGDIFCDKCTQGRIALTADENAQPVRVCDRCMAEVSQRLSYAKEAPSKPAGLHSHEDLARKLQEEMDKNRKSSSGSKSSDGSGRRMREVACPTCTVHLQVQVPASGSETIECGVCQHPFLVSAH